MCPICLPSQAVLFQNLRYIHFKNLGGGSFTQWDINDLLCQIIYWIYFNWYWPLKYPFSYNKYDYHLHCHNLIQGRTRAARRPDLDLCTWQEEAIWTNSIWLQIKADYKKLLILNFGWHRGKMIFRFKSSSADYFGEPGRIEYHGGGVASIFIICLNLGQFGGWLCQIAINCALCQDLHAGNGGKHVPQYVRNNPHSRANRLTTCD